MARYCLTLGFYKRNNQRDVRDSRLKQRPDDTRRAEDEEEEQKEKTSQDMFPKQHV